MVTKLLKISGSSSDVTFVCKGAIRIHGTGEYFIEGGWIAGFSVSKASLQFESGEILTVDEQEELIRRYEERMSEPNVSKKWTIRFT